MNGHRPGRYIIGGDGVPYGPFPPAPNLADVNERRLRDQLAAAEAHTIIDHQALERCWELMRDLATLAGSPAAEPPELDGRGVLRGVAWLLYSAITGEPAP